ncbi:MAG TPA: hypothetical protein VH583_10215 [Vicinamibacterales bacterium]
MLQAQHRRPNELLLVRLALPKHRRQLAGEFVRDADLLQDLAELANQFLLAHVRIAAWTTVACAVVVDVLALLRLRCECATTPATHHHTGECMLTFRVARMVGCGEHILHSGKEVTRNDWLVKALMQLSQPVELAVVDRVLEELMNLGFDQRRPARPVRQPDRRRLLRQRL